MAALDRNSQARTRRILEDLEAVRENLLALSDDIWLSIDHNDPNALEAGVGFKREFNAKLASFGEMTDELLKVVQRYTSVELDAAEKTGDENHEQNQRIVAELNRETPHGLDEDFTYKRPHGFILAGEGTTGITTWRRLYELTCHKLYARNPDRFRSLSEDAELLNSRGREMIARDGSSMIAPLEIAKSLFVEGNLSANSIRNKLKHLLVAFELPATEFRVFLRQDRDAGREAELEG